jgi:hypothetical protein
MLCHRVSIAPHDRTTESLRCALLRVIFHGLADNGNRTLAGCFPRHASGFGDSLARG